MKIEVFFRARMSIVHAANCKTLLPWLPLLKLVLPNKFRRKVLVEELLCSRIFNVGFEVGSKVGVLVLALLNHIPYIWSVFFILCDQLLIGKVDLKSYNVGLLIMQPELKQPPKVLHRQKHSGSPNTT